MTLLEEIYSQKSPRHNLIILSNTLDDSELIYIARHFYTVAVIIAESIPGDRKFLLASTDDTL